MIHRLQNRLRQYRRQAGLSQDEMAFLLGSSDSAQVSRYEKGHHVPELRRALAYTTILGVPLAELFPGIQVSVKTEVEPRVKQLRAALEKKRSENCTTHSAKTVGSKLAVSRAR